MKDFLTLEEAAGIRRWTVDSIKNKIFSGELVPSYEITKPHPVSSPDEPVPDKSKRKPKAVKCFKGMVDIFNLTGNRDCQNPNIKIYPYHKSSSVDDFLSRPLLRQPQSGELVAIELTETLEIHEDDLVIRLDYFKNFCAGDNNALQRLAKYEPQKSVEKPKQPRKAPCTTGRRNAKSSFMDDALCEYWTKHKKDPESVDAVIGEVQVGMGNRQGDEKYKVVSAGEKPDNYLTLETAKGQQTFSHKQVKKSFEYRLTGRAYRDMTPRAKLPT